MDYDKAQQIKMFLDYLKNTPEMKKKVADLYKQLYPNLMPTGLNNPMPYPNYKLYSQNNKVVIEWDSSIDAYRLSAPFDPILINIIKATIPTSDKLYTGALSKQWLFKEQYLLGIKQYCEIKWPGCVTVIYNPLAPGMQAQNANSQAANPKPKLICQGCKLEVPLILQSTQLCAACSIKKQNQNSALSKSGSTEANNALAFCKLVPYNLMRKAYLGAIQELHPDKGGNSDKASELNAMWKYLQENIYNS
jgi:hypothetical protein